MRLLFCGVLLVFRFVGFVNGDCLPNGDQCSRNKDCCSGNCTYASSLSCQPVELSDADEKKSLLDFSSLGVLGLKNMSKIETKAEEVRQILLATKSKLNDLKESLKSVSSEKLATEIKGSIETVIEKGTKYNAECLAPTVITMAKSASEATELGVKCSYYATTQAVTLTLQVSALDTDFKTGLAKTGGKVLLDCTRNSLRFGGLTVKQCAQIAVDGVFDYLANIEKQMLDILDTMEKLVSNVVYCKQNAFLLADKTRNNVKKDVELCKEL